MVDRRGYRGRSWQWWAKQQLAYYSERQEARRDEALARTLDEIASLPVLTPTEARPT